MDNLIVYKRDMEKLAGISEKNRNHLTKLHRLTNGLVSVAEAAKLLELDRTPTAKMLSAMATHGWVRRLRRGLYLLIPLTATSPNDWRVDPWVVAEHVFRPAYIAGWSACEHWEFTEQIFRDVAVFTTSPIRQRQVTIDQTNFVLKKISGHLFFGTRPVWRKDTRIYVSDPTRTLVDILDNPKWGGGMRHVAQIADAYLASQHRDEVLLIDHLKRIGNSAAAKRLGHFLETRHGESIDLIENVKPLISTGYVLLDPTTPPRGAFVSRWNVRVNLELAQ